MNININAFCKSILSERAYRNRPIILCEGQITGSLVDKNSKQHGQQRRYTRSPSTAKEQDSDFYKKCCPRWWQTSGTIKLPEFINAGSRSQVLRAFFELLELHNQSPNDSYLNPDRLFALVDLDIQNQSLPVHPEGFSYNTFENIEEIFKSLYSQGRFQGLANYMSHILVTGLIHKEAYFLLPQLQDLLTLYDVQYSNAAIDLYKLYPEIAEGLEDDKDLKKNLIHISHRLNDCCNLDCSNLSQLKQSWLRAYHDDPQDHQSLVTLLFMIKKIKPYWEKVHSALGYDPSKFQDQICDMIAQFYRNRYRNKDEVQGEVPADHIPCLFRTIYRIAYEP
ncbi:hypothetical protein [Prochlorothrix hollandica]|uniref:hypothetical protein n=1 Tax=Prochlorothrix hollandica TaxID=1223 RepID=UPI00034DE346|nr:hypothetical protein [Prochlorothrix hollandica]